MDLSKVTRITVVNDEKGITYEDYHVFKHGCGLSLQDDVRTLKIIESLKGADTEEDYEEDEPQFRYSARKPVFDTNIFREKNVATGEVY
jgi:hypothetical protein